MFRPLALVLSSTVLLAAPLQAQDQPNVLLILVDDLGYYDLSCDGATAQRTPNLDQLAAQPTATRFTDFHSAHPVCSPTRAAIMTGRYPHRVGIDNWIGAEQSFVSQLPESEVTYAEPFNAAGYHTGYIGKWHLGNPQTGEGGPEDHGFQWVFATNDAGQPGSYHAPYRNDNNAATAIPDLEDVDAYLTDALFERAMGYLDEHSGSKQPWFLTLSTYTVHTPIEPPLDTLEEVREHLTETWANADAALPVKQANGSQSRSRQDNPGYAAMVERLDREVGRLLTHVHELGLDESTIVVFTSDNGALSTLPNHVGPASCLPDRAGKGWLYSGGTHVPTIMRMPIDPEAMYPQLIRENDHFATNTDLMPTLLELCAVPAPEGVEFDGVSLAPILQGPATTEVAHGPFIWSYPHDHGSGHEAGRALRVQDEGGEWKLIHRLADDRLELYNLDQDAGEDHDLAAEMPERATALAKDLTRLYEETSYRN